MNSNHNFGKVVSNKGCKRTPGHPSNPCIPGYTKVKSNFLCNRPIARHWQGIPRLYLSLLQFGLIPEVREHSVYRIDPTHFESNIYVFISYSNVLLEKYLVSFNPLILLICFILAITFTFNTQWAIQLIGSTKIKQ